MKKAIRYSPPSSERIKSLQNERQSIKLLLAQRRLYSRAKIFLSVRWFGMLVIAIGAPIVSFLYPELTIGVFAVAGLWLFLGRTLLIRLEQTLIHKAASVQERFDRRVFIMPEVRFKEVSLSLEDLVEITSDKRTIQEIGYEECLFDWYPITEESPGIVSVAISQRANVAYTGRLMQQTAFVWKICTVLWLTVLLVISLLNEMLLKDFLLGIFFPVLPAIIDLYQFIKKVQLAANERRELSNDMQYWLEQNSDKLSSRELLDWQDKIYELRRSSPLIPDVIYWLARNKNEAVMHSVADDLRNNTKK